MRYIKLFEEYDVMQHLNKNVPNNVPSHFSLGGKIMDTSAEDMQRAAGGNLPKELENIKKKFSGKNLNFGITKDGEKFNVYKWSSIFEPKLIGEFNELKDAEQAVFTNDK